MKVVLALIGAIAMVAAAVFVRDNVIDSSPSAPPRPVRLVCATELAPQCDAIKGATVTVEAAGITADRLVAKDAPGDIDAWVVPTPWPQLVDAQRSAAGEDPVFSAATPTVAASPLGLVLRSERAATLAAACKVGVDAIAWRCVGDQAGVPWASIGGNAAWGDVKPGIADPTQSAVGLVVAAHALASRVGSADFGREVFDDPAITAWFTTLARAVPPAPAGSTPLQRFLVVPATYDAVGDARGLITSSVGQADASRRRDFTIPNAPDTARAIVVVAGMPGRQNAVATAVRSLRSGAPAQQFTNNGWTIVKDPQPGPTGLPDGGTMQVIRAQWSEALR